MVKEAIHIERQIQAVEDAIALGKEHKWPLDFDALKFAHLSLGVLQRDKDAVRAFLKLLSTQPGMAALFREFPGAEFKEVRRA